MYKIDRQITLDGRTVRIRANSEQEYAQKVLKSFGTTKTAAVPTLPQKHGFAAYAKNWFEVFSKPNTEAVTAITYERQLRLHLFPAFRDMAIEDIQPVDIQRMFNAMDGAKETKQKARMVLNMVLEQAMEDGLITKNPLKSRSIRINGRSSKAIVPYSIDEMQFIVANLDQVKNSVDRMYVALHALHPFRLEEVMGLQWKDIDLEQRVIHIERVVTHPDHNQPVVKDTKTECSHRTLAIVPQIIRYLTPGQPNDFVFGGDKPFSYTVIRRMCNRIAKDIGFEGKITPQRFRTTVLTDLYDSTKDIKQAQAAAGHTTAAMTLKHYVKGRTANHDTAAAIATAYGLT